MMTTTTTPEASGDGKGTAPPLKGVERAKKVAIDYARVLWDYKALLAAGSVLFGPSALLSLIPPNLTSLGICSTMLCTHGSTMWGIVTSVFLYDSWTNIPSYFAILIVYAQFSDQLDPIERRRRAKFAAAAMFGAAFVANAFWVHFLPSTYSWGPSGVVYGLWGVMLAYTLFDGMPKSPKGLDPRRWYDGKKERKAAFGSLAMFAATTVMLTTETSVFLSAGPGINVFVHGVSFMGGYFAAHVYRWAYGRRPLPWSR